VPLERGDVEAVAAHDAALLVADRDHAGPGLVQEP
jgi:hypothetical protein